MPTIPELVRDSGSLPRADVEVTESGLIEDLGAAGNLLARLRQGGLRVAIDDFGTGYSSLAYLKALPLDYLKIDKRLSQDIAGSTRDRIVVRSVIDMARSLGLDVIAEGETEEQLALLAREGCTSSRASCDRRGRCETWRGWWDSASPQRRLGCRRVKALNGDTYFSLKIRVPFWVTCPWAGAVARSARREGGLSTVASSSIRRFDGSRRVPPGGRFAPPMVRA